MSDPERNRRAAVLAKAVLFTAVVGISGSAVVSWLSHDPSHVIGTAVSLAAISLVTLALVRAGHETVAAHLFVGSFWLAGLGTTVQYGGIGGIGVNAVLTSVFAAGLLLPWRSMVGFAVASGVAFAAFAAFDVRIDRVPAPSSAELFFVSVTGIGMTVIFVFLAVRSIQEALAEARMAQQQTETLVDSSPDAIVTIDPHGHMLSVNAAVARMLGGASHELLGQSFVGCAGLDPAIVPSPQQLESGPKLFPCTLCLPDARATPVEVHASVQPESTNRQLVVRDISARVAAKQVQEQLEEGLRQSRRLEALGQLAGGVAHDFNNMLTAILSFATLTAEQEDLPAEVKENMGYIREAGERGAGLTQQLLAFARRQVLEPRVIEVANVIRSVDGMLRRLIPENIQIRMVLEPGVAILADPAQLEQIIVNLVVNARDAMPQGGQLVVETRAVTLDDEHPHLAPGAYVQIAVTDQGAGMDKQTLSRVFEPFYTTKGHGAGLGLATVHGIVVQSGGHISVESEVGTGSTFKIHFPLVEAPVSASSGPDGQLVDHPIDGLILVVDDDKMVRQSVALLLQSMGFKVVSAPGGEEALELLTQHHEVEVLLTDVVMPSMSGGDLAEAVRARHPDIKVLFMSGYTENAVMHDGTLDPRIELIRKPFTKEVLAARIRALLDGVSQS